MRALAPNFRVRGSYTEHALAVKYSIVKLSCPIRDITNTRELIFVMVLSCGKVDTENGWMD